MYLIYDNLEDAQLNADIIFANMLEEYAIKNDGFIYDKEQKKKKKIKDVLKTNKKHSPFVIPGKNCKSKKDNLDSGFTISWDMPIKLSDDRWCLVKPSSEFMQDVTFDSESENIDSLHIEIDE